MASGDPVVQIHDVSPPATLFAAPATRLGGSTPAEQIPHWAFDATTIEYMDFYCFLSGYSGLGLTFTLPWIGASATTGVSRWEIGVQAIPDDANDIDVAHTYVYTAVDATTASVSGEYAYDTVVLTDGANMDGWANNQAAIVRVRRNASHANDTMSGDAQLALLTGKET